MAEAAKGKKEPPSFDRRDRLRDIEKQVQAQWAASRVYEVDAPTAESKQEHFLVTFPYPYMNGVLHLGHAFTVTKAEFAARYQRLLGKRVLFPFGFHCTGMPIAACADKLKKEVAKFGNPPQFPAEEDEKDEAEDADTENVAPANNANTNTNTNTTQDAAATEEKKKKKKGKEAKKTSKQKYQWRIMAEMGVPESEIHKFQDARHWLQYFPPIGKTDLQSFGVAVDFRRSFITTDINPYYDAFIRWQFNLLKKKDKIAFGKRLTVFSPVSDQPCADHDRKSGEGVGSQEYTIIKLELQKPYPASLAALEGKYKVFLAAATLRPETMYGQTNCWILPDGEYGAFEMLNNEAFVCTGRSALNMSYQEMTPVRAAPKKLATVKGSELIGCAVKAPLTNYEKVYVLPLLTISMSKGTGVVTSVPSDAPDDYAALMDLKKKEAMRKKFNLSDAQVLPFDVISIIDIPGLGNKAAASLCEEMKVQSQNDRQKLDVIKERVYKEGFYSGVMIIGPHAGMKVEQAKTVIRQEMIQAGTAAPYAEPESLVIARTEEECVVALTDQWFLKYGEESWKQQVSNHVDNVLETYNPNAKRSFQEIVNWLREWACSRSYGLGTSLPWDTQFVIESLSDSTIYMAYYAIAYLLQGGVLDGSKIGPAQIKPEQLTDEVFDYIFRHKECPAYPVSSGIPQATLDHLRREFEYWYPMSLRVSGKDLIGNHLTMSLYNHAAIWENQPEYWPRSFFTNGHVMVNNEKMSKSLGNFMTIKQVVEKFSADAARAALADAGDGLMDANFDEEYANASILRLTKEQEWLTETLVDSRALLSEEPATTFLDRVFENNINRCITQTKSFYDKMQFREAFRVGHYELLNARDRYRINVTDKGMKRALIERFAEAMLIMLSPICPHWTQYMWEKLGKSGFIIDAKWPESGPEDPILARMERYLQDVAHNMNAFLANPKKNKSKSKEDDKPLDSCVLYVAEAYPEWQQIVISHVKSKFEATGSAPTNQEVLADLTEKKLLPNKKATAEAMAFTASMRNKLTNEGASALELKMPFNELDFVRQHSHLLFRGLKLTNYTVYSTSDPNAPDFPNSKKETAIPGSPVAFFYSGASNPSS